MTLDTATLLTDATQLLKRCDFEPAKTAADAALHQATAANDRGSVARAQKLIGDYYRYNSNAFEAARLYEEVLKAAVEVGDKALLADTQLAYGRLKMPQGQQDNAWLLYESAGELYEALGDVGGKGQTLGGRGDVAFHRGDAATARKLYDEALVLCEQAGDHLGQAHTLKSLGRMVHSLEGPEAALGILQRSLDAYQASGFRYGEAFTWQYYAQILGQERRLPEAAEALGKAADLFDAINLPGQAGRMRDFQTQVKSAMVEQGA
ncbi:MAG: tetratricopeptide repeat protein [bacterium]